MGLCALLQSGLRADRDAISQTFTFLSTPVVRFSWEAMSLVETHWCSSEDATSQQDRLHTLIHSLRIQWSAASDRVYHDSLSLPVSLTQSGWCQACNGPLFWWGVFWVCAWGKEYAFYCTYAICEVEWFLCGLNVQSHEGHCQHI